MRPKYLILAIIKIALANELLAQSSDSTINSKTVHFNNGIIKGINSNAGRLLHSENQKQWIIKDHVVIKTSNLQLTLIENEIADLESLECKALLKRDTTIIKSI